MKILKNFKLDDKEKKLCKTDWIIIGIMILLYGIISFYRLGDTKVPVTYQTFNDDDSRVITLKEEKYINKMRYYTGYNLGEITISSSLDGIVYNEVTSLSINSVFTWQDVSLSTRAKYIKFTAVSDNSTLGDVCFYNGSEKVPIIVDLDNPLTDELELVPEEISYMNSTYFDEIYYARSAYEYVNGMDAYEWSHPPLGKLIMSIPVLLFGFSPFTYRLMGNIIGILFIPLMYIIGKRFFKNRRYALLSGALMMFDNFHFAHTRIALVDGFQVFFILLSILFMKEYIDCEKDSAFKKKAIYLLLSGTFIGCAIATKWNAAYVALGLAIVFFIHLLKQYNVNVIKYLKNKLSVNLLLKYISLLVIIPYVLYYISMLIINKSTSSGIVTIYFIMIGLILLTKLIFFIKSDTYLSKLAIVCIISFIVIPFIIYILCYLLFPNLSYYDGTFAGIFNTNKMMYDYHANLVATHPFSSKWYEWPIMRRPVWFYTGSSNNLPMTISDIGNPAIWWFGIIAFIYLVISVIKTKEKNNIFILIFIITTFVPYVFIGRLMFMYHYFITLPFVMLGIVSFVKWITEKTKSNKFYYCYLVLIAVTFIIFYPIVSGIPISPDYVNSLKWLPQWYF